MNEERRQYTRYKTTQNSFAVFRPGFEAMGKIKDISWGGVCFEYLGAFEFNGERALVDLFMTDTDFRLSRIPCKIAYDKSLGENQAMDNGMTLRRCAVAFEDMSPFQKSQLEYFLANFVGGEA